MGEGCYLAEIEYYDYIIEIYLNLCYNWGNGRRR